MGTGNLRADIAGVLARIPVDFGGGCSLSKACCLAYLIRRFRMRSTLDIGVYRGRSLFPQALAHARFTGGVAYGVDPWDASEAWERDNPALREAIGAFVEGTDFPAIHEEVTALNRELRLEGHCVLLRRTSSDAITYFRERDIRFDLIHIDGNHDTEKVREDVDLYLPRLADGGFVVVDDISWDSVRPACADLSASMSRVWSRVDRENDYAVFWKPPSPARAAALRMRLMWIARG